MSTKIKINSAFKSELMKIKGIGEINSDKIIQLRSISPITNENIGYLPGLKFSAEALDKIDFSINPTENRYLDDLPDLPLLPEDSENNDIQTELPISAQASRRKSLNETFKNQGAKPKLQNRLPRIYLKRRNLKINTNSNL